jgi:hypothetical protein
MLESYSISCPDLIKLSHFADLAQRRRGDSGSKEAQRQGEYRGDFNN